MSASEDRGSWLGLPRHGAEQPWKPRVNPWIIAVCVMIPTFMEVLDTSVANVALPHIAGSLSVTRSEVTWVLTSYLVANAIILPTSAWLSRRFGRRRVLLASIVIFTAASVLCGSATRLDGLVSARVVQGLGGGTLQPLSQAILLEIFPPAMLGAAMAVFGIGVVAGPIVGPVLGGWITDQYTWRWIFYVNVPVGLVALLLVAWAVEDPPWVREPLRDGFDPMGFGLLAVGLGALQVMLDRGQEAGWMAAPYIRVLALAAAVCLTAFVLREARAAEPLVSLRVLRNRNFAVGTAMVFVLGVVLYANGALLPLMLQNLMGYSAFRSGLTVSPRGLGSLIGMLAAVPLMTVLDKRLLVAAGFMLLSWSSWLLGGLNLSVGPDQVAWPAFVSGLSLGLIFVPLTALAVGRLRAEQIGSATALFNLVRNLGGSVGVATAMTVLARNAQVQQVQMAAHVTPFNLALQQRLLDLQAWFGAAGAYGHALRQQALELLYGMVVRQAGVNAFVDDFRLFAVLTLACLPLVFLFRRVAGRHAWFVG